MVKILPTKLSQFLVYKRLKNELLQNKVGPVHRLTLSVTIERVALIGLRVTLSRQEGSGTALVKKYNNSLLKNLL